MVSNHGFFACLAMLTAWATADPTKTQNARKAKTPAFSQIERMLLCGVVAQNGHEELRSGIGKGLAYG
jgi:hypothetical protein